VEEILQVECEDHKKYILMPELKVNKEESTVEYAGFSFQVINDLNLDVEKVSFHSAVIIDGKDRSFIRQIVRRIRSHNSPDVYLKPIFILKGINIIDPVVNKLVDGTLFSLEQIELIIPEVERILTKTAELHFTNSISFEAQMIEKVICFMYTCEIHELEPIPYIYSANNYYYPILSVNFNHRDEHLALEILDLAEQEGIFESQYVDRVYLCPGCQNGQLTYREVCPKCGSSNSTTEDIIHHFPCAYVGPLSDFTNEIDDQLDCPKCNKRLRHIGVDYDKPSVLHECKACDHKFQDFNVKAKCLACAQDSLVEQLKGREIRKYSLTKKGQLAAINGFVAASKDIEEIIGTVKFETFITMLKYEIERLRQTEGASNVCAIHLSNPSQLYSKMGSEVQKVLLKDLVKVIRSNIRTSDIISFQSSSTIVLSMNEIPTRIAKKILTEIVEMLKRLIATSFKDIEIEFEMEVIKLDYKLSPQLHIQQLTKNFA
jgi:GGDEF domain-containing protein